jgi:hypothetical protein
MVEKFIEGTMYHVNGILKDKKLVAVWPFQYLNTNFGFTKGSFYGNASIQPKDEIYEKLIDITKKVLEALPKCNVFHLELFYSRNEFYVCEIAARRPGGSIGLLIEELVEPRFVEIEFRINNELPIEVTCIDKSIGDVLVPKPIGTITKIPDQIPFGILKVLGKVGDVYTGFDINHLNTLARIVCEGDDVGDVCCKLEKSATEFISLVQYNKLG